MVAGMSGCRPAHAFNCGPVHCGPMPPGSDEQSSTSQPPAGGMQAFMNGIISPFMACWQPPVSACLSPTSPYGGWEPGVPPTPPNRYTNQATAGISRPHPNDVLCGRGGATNSHVGNLNFRCLVAANKDVYVTLTKKQKMLMARGIVNAVHNQDPSGRFMQKDASTGTWFDIGLPRSLEKTSQALREKTATDKPVTNSDHPPDDRDGSEAGSLASVESKLMSTPSTPTNSAPSSPLTTPKSRVSTAEAPAITIPEHLEAQFNPQYARRRLSFPKVPPAPHQSPQPYLPHFSPHRPPPPPPPPYYGVGSPYGPRPTHEPRAGTPPMSHDPRAGPPPMSPPPMSHDPRAGPPPMYPPHYMGYDRQGYGIPLRRSHAPPPGRLPPPQPYLRMVGPPPPPPPSGPPPGVITPDFGSPARREGAQVSPGRRQEWKRRRNSEGSASRLPDASSSSTLSQDMQNRLSLGQPDISSPSSVLQSRERRGSSPESEEMSGLAALSSAALLKLDENK
jgi:hypothetical protein